MAIHILDKSLTQKIAAGEVVERPASVVKELIENSIDAGASNITVEIENGGIGYLRVTDNGCGMNDEDSTLCFKTHATSKIFDEKDLYNISTLGFRGEAIPSIASVSKMTLYTRTKDSEYAIKIVCHGGEIIDKSKSGRPEGTTIIVQDIFYNVPVRLKFLKTASTEAARISSIIQKYILARPDIAFRFISSGKDVYISSGDGNIKNAIYSVYGKDIYHNLIPVNYESGYARIEGFIGDPTIARGTRSMQNLFVNGRYIRSDIISNSVKQGYLNRIMPAKYPFYTLNLSLPYNQIDVNVHPNKLEVRFIDEGFIQECFFKAVKSAFDTSLPNMPLDTPPNIGADISSIPDNQNDDNSYDDYCCDYNEQSNREATKQVLINLINDNIKVNDTEFKKSDNMLAQHSSVLKPTNKEQAEIDYDYKYSYEQKPETITVARDSVEQRAASKSSFELQMTLNQDIDNYRIIGQIFNTYILIEYEDKLVFIDQHAAHERINTNKMLKEFQDRSVLSQVLLIPCVIQLTSEDFTIAIEAKELFLELGFEIEEFGNNTVRINTVPHIFGEENVEGFFFETLDTIKLNPKLETRKHIIFDMACKHSIKAGERLSNEEIKELLKISLKDKSPLNCPHGRPIIIIKPKKEIEKWFMRIV